jgi:hypothetical protein
LLRAAAALGAAAAVLPWLFDGGRGGGSFATGFRGASGVDPVLLALALLGHAALAVALFRWRYGAGRRLDRAQELQRARSRERARVAEVPREDGP